jgi:signal transduction histidine kinase
VVAHELRGPLSPIRLAAALLGRLPARELPRMQAIIERGVQHMSTLVNDLLDQARVQTGKLRIERRRIDIEQIVEEAIFACRPAIESRAQSLTVTLAARPLAASGDPVRLAQVFRNLLDNASKYTPDGGRLWVTMTVLGSTLELIFADDGIGVTAEALPHVFDAFAQDAHAVGFNGFGLGIGLAVVRELVLAHGGTVLASSDGPGLGSQFVITLPLIEDGVPA